MTSAAQGTVRVGDLFDPIAGVLPSGVLSNDTIDTSRQSFTNRVEYSWSDNPLRFNNQGQKWEQDYRLVGFSFQSYPGVHQCSTPRRISSAIFGITNYLYPHVAEFEFVFTGQKLSFEFLNKGGNGVSGGVLNPDAIDYGSDCQVYIEYGGRMWKAADLPKTTTSTSGNRDYRNIAFTNPVANVRIRFITSGGFICISTEQSAIIAPSPPRPVLILDGDSFVEPSQALTADSATQWFTTGIADFLFERTGFVIFRRGQGATGFFTNGATQIFDDTLGAATDAVKTATGFSRWFSASRTQWMTDALGAMTALSKQPFVNYPGEDFGQPLGRRPLLYVLNGTWNDASAGGVTEAQMYARAKVCYQWVHTTDPFCTLVHVGPEPFDDALFANPGVIGPPRVGDRSDIHRQGQMRAIAEVGRSHYINAFGPDLPTRWWTGPGPDPLHGSQDVPTSSQQSHMGSVHDGIHYTRIGGRYYANKIADQLAEIRVPAARVNGLV